MSAGVAIPDPGPSGYRVRRGAEVLQVFECPTCPARMCSCFSTAWAFAKRAASTTGKVITIETLDGRKLAERRPIGGGRLASPEERGRPVSEEVAPGRDDETESVEAMREQEAEES